MNQLYVFYRLNKEINDRKDKFSIQRFLIDIVKETMIINPGVDMTVEEEIRNVEECLIKLTNKNWIIRENDEYMVNENNRGVKEILEKMESIENELKGTFDIEWKEEEVMSGGVLKEEKEYMKKIYDMIHQEFCQMKKEREEWEREKSSYMYMEEEEEEEESSDEGEDEYEKIKSSDGSTEYVVNMSRWTCNCPGFKYSLYDPPQCKHVYQVYIQKNNGKTDTTEFEEILRRMVSKKR